MGSAGGYDPEQEERMDRGRDQWKWKSYHCIKGKARMWYPSNVLRMLETLPFCKANNKLN